MEDSKAKFDERDRDIVFSHAVKAGKRIYYLDVRKTRKDEYYLSITESKKIADPETPDGKAVFEKHKIFLYREDFSNFIDGLTRTMRFIHEADTAASQSISGQPVTGPIPEPEPVSVPEPQENKSKDSDLDFEISF